MERGREGFVWKDNEQLILKNKFFLILDQCKINLYFLGSLLYSKLKINRGDT